MARQSARKRSLATRRIAEALEILASLNVPNEQRNERSALVLLALTGMTPRKSWSEATTPLLGITEMMSVFEETFARKYAPNTRETVRRFSVHQFVQMGLVVKNPDYVRRAVNSPFNRYQATPSLLDLVRTFGSGDWEKSLAAFMATDTLSALHPREREMSMVAVKMPNGKRIRLTAGGQNELVKQIIEAFCPRFTPGGIVVYLGDTGKKHRHFEFDYLKRLGVEIDEHGKMPDVLVHMPEKNWLVLIEAVTSHGPIGIKRYNELKALFASARCSLVFVTAFLTRSAMTRYLGVIAWETEVWLAEAPSHLIHFNGERFLGPYE
jgi:adenine-specific DNA-methyltransferase